MSTRPSFPSQGSQAPARLAVGAAHEPFAAAWRKLVGIALLWLGLASLVFVATGSTASNPASLVAVLGFASFAAGLSIFAQGLERSIVAALAGRAEAPAREGAA